MPLDGISVFEGGVPAVVVRGISICEGGVTPRVTLRSPTAIRCRSFGALVVAPFGRIGNTWYACAAEGPNALAE